MNSYALIKKQPTRKMPNGMQQTTSTRQIEIVERCIALLKLIQNTIEGLAEWRGGKNADFEDYVDESHHTDVLGYAATN
jgi:hypothetical protein